VHYSRILKVLASMVVVLGLAACKPATEQSKEQSKTLAEVNGSVITVQDLKNEVDRLPPYLKPMAQSLDGRKELLERVIARTIMLEEAKKAGVDKSKEVAERLEDLRKELIVATYLKQKVEKEAQLTDDEMKKYYDENKEKFKTGAQVRASHILVKAEQDAQTILTQLQSGANFEEMARKNSLDATAAKGGDLGWFSSGAMVPEFNTVAFSLKEGATSGVIKTQYGFHIIKVTGKRPAGIRTFDEVKDQIKAALLPAKQQEVFQKMMAELKKTSKVSVKEDVLKEMDLSTADAAGGADVGKK
jgi:peptidyl-prolyl cis-trans isomerase C